MSQTNASQLRNCGKALCNGRKFLDFGNVMAIFDKCVGSPGKWKNEAGKIIKPEQTSAKFTHLNCELILVRLRRLSPMVSFSSAFCIL